MSRRQAFIDTCNHKKPSKIITDLGGCPLSGLSKEAEIPLKRLFGFEGEERSNPYTVDERILKHFNIDTRGVGNILRPSDSLYKDIDENTRIDEWGIKSIYTGVYWENVGFPLKGATLKDLDNYKFPDPMSVSMEDIREIKKEAKYLYENTDYVICGSHPVYGIFELGCWMCGFDDFLMKMALEPEFIHRFFEIVLDYQLKVSELYYSEIGEYIHYTSSGDDFATQASTFMSVGMFDEFIKPYLAERIKKTKSFTNAKFLHHSCGSVSPFIPSLLEAGVDILNPIQPVTELMEPKNLKAAYGDKIVFHGGLDTQALLPNGTKEEIEAETFRLADAMNQDGGYIFAAAHNIQGDVPPENIIAVFEAINKYNNSL